MLLHLVLIWTRTSCAGRGAALTILCPINSIGMHWWTASVVVLRPTYAYACAMKRADSWCCHDLNPVSILAIAQSAQSAVRVRTSHSLVARMYNRCPVR
jgi:hypothetical protein